MPSFKLLAPVLLAVHALGNDVDLPKHHHHHHHHHHGHHHAADKAAAATRATTVADTEPADTQVLMKMHHLEAELADKEKKASTQATKLSASKDSAFFRKGQLNVNGPLPVDFGERFSASVALATGCQKGEVQLLGAVPVPEAHGNVEEVMFKARGSCVTAVEDQAGDPDSKLANGMLHSFLVAKDDGDSGAEPCETSNKVEGTVAKSSMPEIDMAMPYGELEPFGRENTAQELTASSIYESDAMVDQLEKAEVAEEKRAVFRALTRLRGAAITSYDGIARSQTGNIDEYARTYQWRTAHPIRHLAQDEADVGKWAFPDGSE